MSISDLKAMLNLESDAKINILQDKVSGNKSFNVNGVWFRCSKTLDTSLPVIFHTDKYDEDGNPDWLQGILSNVANSTKESIGSVG
jgi:hypothetical protein